MYFEAPNPPFLVIVFCRNLQRDGQTRQANDRTSWIIKILQKVRFLWQPYHQHGVPVSRNIFGAKLSPNDGVIDHPSSFDAPYIIHRPPHLLPRVLVTQDISYTTYQTPHLSKRGCKKNSCTVYTAIPKPLQLIYDSVKSGELFRKKYFGWLLQPQMKNKLSPLLVHPPPTHGREGCGGQTVAFVIISLP